jgi:hypothetical protein
LVVELVAMAYWPAELMVAQVVVVLMAVQTVIRLVLQRQVQGYAGGSHRGDYPGSAVVVVVAGGAGSRWC